MIAVKHHLLFHGGYELTTPNDLLISFVVNESHDLDRFVFIQKKKHLQTMN